MPTSSPILAAALLDALVDTGIPFAILHREWEIAHGEVGSDVDVAIEGSLTATVQSLSKQALRYGLQTVMTWPYDVNSLTTFWTTADASDGVQLDLISDPEGRGKYGVRTDALLEHQQRGVRWPALDPVDEVLYLLQKRQHKRQATDVDALLARARELGWERITARGRHVLHRRGFERLQAGNSGDHSGTLRSARLSHFANSRRCLSRLARPVGFWMEVRETGPRGTGAAEAIAARFGRIVLGGAALQRPHRPSRQLAWWTREIAPRRWRPMIVVSTAGRAHWPPPDLTLPSGMPVETMARSAVAALARRATQSLSERSVPGSPS